MTPTMSKICRYHCLRSVGLRLYARKTWTCLTPVTRTSFHTTAQSTGKTDNPLFTGDADMNWFDKLKESAGFQGKLRYPRQTLHVNGTRLYICCEQAVEYNNLMDVCGLPQTFFTWYKLTTLHVWLLMTRLITEGREGRHVRNRVVTSFHEDMKHRSKAFSRKEGFSVSSEDFNEYNEIFLGALINYDEGLLGDDKALAGAIWRILYGYQEADAEKLELFVHYIRKQAHHLQLQRSVDIVANGFLMFLPLHGDRVNKTKLEELKVHLVDKLGGLKMREYK